MIVQTKTKETNKMSITKKHLNQLANIVARLHNDKYFSKDTQSVVIVDNLIKNFAKENCPNFDYDKWNGFVSKQIQLDKKQEEKTMAFIQSLGKKTA
jgi:hypothetical protein